jgi:hypothetical protein
VPDRHYSECRKAVIEEAQNFSIMWTFQFPLLTRITFACALTSLLMTGCGKEEISPAAASTDPVDRGSPKSVATFVRFMGGSAPKSCSVQRGNMVHGNLIGVGGSSGIWNILTSPAGFMHVTGDSDYPYCSGINPGHCVFERPTASGTFSPWYYIKPNQGATPRKILKVRLIGGAGNPTSGVFFEYKPSTNTWVNLGGTVTSTYFEWSVVTSMPTLIHC